VDLTADVDFASLRRTASRQAGALTYGPVDQGAFLSAMGCPQRLEALLDQDHVSDDMAEALVDAFERLVDPSQMGSRYKCLAIVDAKQRGPPPGGFEAEPHAK
jgi:NADH dehydrogenase [ubiquinone] 1 alpha subcomplex assembly factor 7